MDSGVKPDLKAFNARQTAQKQCRYTLKKSENNTILTVDTEGNELS